MTTPSDGLNQWRRGVAAVLARAGRADADGGQPERRLDATTEDGLTVAALYTPLDAGEEAPLPGTPPFTRGVRADRDPTLGWGVRVRHGLGERDARTVNQAVLDDLENGATSVWLTVGGSDLPPAALATALDGVFLDLAPVVLDAGPHFTTAAEAFLALVDEADVDLGEVHANLGADPLTEVVRGGAEQLEEAAELARRAHHHAAPLRAITVDAGVFHDLGASDAQELGSALAAGVEYLRALTSSGLENRDALRQIAFRLVATDDQFATIAKFRAARTAWARVAEVVGAPEAGDAPQHAVTSGVMMTRRDPWVNVLRTTVAAFAAGVGGADAVTVLPFDAARPGGVPGVSDRFAARMTRNTQLLLLEESHLGRVLDPAGGSYYVEARTRALARAAWDVFLEIERAGGFRRAWAEGVISGQIGVVRARRARDVAHRRRPITGVSQFPDLDEEIAGTATGALPRHAQPFEALRDRSDAHLRVTGARPAVRLITLGPPTEHAARTGWVSTLLATGGIATTDEPRPVTVLCGTDRRYADDGLRALRQARPGRVLLAGPLTAWPPHADDTPDATLEAGDDAVAALAHLLDTLEVAP